LKQEAVQLVQASDKKHPVPRIAWDLGVCTETLRKWAKQAEIDARDREGLTTGENAELRRLHKEVKVPHGTWQVPDYRGGDALPISEHGSRTADRYHRYHPELAGTG
jgi:hypothetical protein